MEVEVVGAIGKVVVAEEDAVEEEEGVEVAGEVCRIEVSRLSIRSVMDLLERNKLILMLILMKSQVEAVEWEEVSQEVEVGVEWAVEEVGDHAVVVVGSRLWSTRVQTNDMQPDVQMSHHTSKLSR